MAPTPGPYATSLLLPGEPLLLLPPGLAGHEVPETSAHCSATTAHMQISKYLYLRHRASRNQACQLLFPAHPNCFPPGCLSCVLIHAPKKLEPPGIPPTAQAAIFPWILSNKQSGSRGAPGWALTLLNSSWKQLTSLHTCGDTELATCTTLPQQPGCYSVSCVMCELA